MAHQDAPDYAGKHPKGTTIDPALAEALKAKAGDGRITCSAAHGIAHELAVAPEAVGVAIDMLRIKISKCQLGLFGYGPQRVADVKAPTISQVMKEAIGVALVDNRLPCLSAWKLAEQFGVTKMELFAACEVLKIRLSACQLGTF